MATDNDFIARRIRSRSLPSLLTYGKQLSPEWKAAATTDQRIYFVNQRTRSTHWFPPPEFWASKLDLPYGWEAAFDNQNKKYYINHVTRITTREDPRSEADQAAYLHMTPIQARRIELIRDATIGFGFVAGSEKPVVIRSVIPNGPSHDKLFANDQILKVNGKDVRDSPQADVISLIKGSVSRIELEVVASEDVQDTKNQQSRKSSLMSRTTRERRRSTPVSVRFADEPALVQVIGPMEPVRRSSVPLIPNVLKVFLENGQTRSFRYDSNTTTEDIFSSFASKLDMRLMEHFSLVLSGPKKGQVSYIQNHEKVSEIYTNRNCSSVNCLCKLNIAFVPKDHFELLSQDPNAFEYLYAQVTNRVVEGFYGVDLKYDLAIKLAALQIQQKAMEAAAGRPVKMSVRQVEKEFGGLGKFVSSDLLHNTRDKELRKILDQQIKQNENLASPGERHMSSLQCKIHYLNLAAEIFSYGGKYFDVVLVDDGNNQPSLKKSKKQHITVIISLKYAVSQVVRGKVNVLCQLADFHEITGFKISVFEDNKRLLRIRLQEGKVIQLICTSLDCTNIIALITGYYKVYVDNTSNTPLPVENEEKWPFSFPQDPPANDAPEFYSRHRVVPDVWSYPSRFRTSNANNKTQVENTTPLNSHEDVFIDLSRAPPRFHETVCEEPAEEHMVAEKVNWKKLDQDGNHEALAPLNATYENEATEVSSEQDDTPQLAMTQGDRDLLEKASSVLKSSTDDINSDMQSSITYGGETDGDSEELNESCKRRPASSGISGEDDLGVKSPKLARTNDFQEDEEGLITELVLAKETWQNKEAGAIVFDESEGEVSVSDKESFSSLSTDGGNNWAVLPANCEELKAQMDDAVVERKEIDLSLQTTGQLSSENGSSESEHMNEEFESTGSVKNDLAVRPEHSATDVLGSSTGERTSLSAEDSGHLVSEFSDERNNLRLTLEQNSFISTDPFRDRSPTPPPSDLGFDERKFDNEGIELVDYVEGDTASKGFDNQKSASKDSKHTDVNKSQSGRDTANKARDLNDHNDGEASHIVSSEFVESSDTETASEMSDEDESLFSTFPEYFQPCRRLKYSGTKQGVLLLAEEDQDDADGLNSAETDQDVAPVSLKEFHAKDDLNSLSPSSSKNAVDTNHEKDWEELSTASSESDECTYEVNAELASEDSEENWKEKKEGRKQEIHEHQDGTNGVPLPISLVSLDACFNDRRDVLLDTHSTLNANGLKVDESTQSFTADKTVLSPPYDQMNFNAKKSTAESVSREEPSTPPELSCGNDGSAGSNLLFDQSKNRDIFFQGFRTLNDPIDQNKLTWKDLHRSYSPSDWIVPSPPTPTPELDEDDIQIVPPPPSDPVTSEDELDKKLKDLIVPPPPSLTESVQTILSIRIASPPPSPADINHNEVDDFMFDYDEIRFLSLTDDHKLAHNNGLVPKQTLNSNFTEDRKIQAQKVETDASSVSKGRDYASKSISISQNTCKTNIPTKQSTTQYIPRERSFGSQAFLLNTSSSGLSILQDSRPTMQGIERRKDVLGEFPNIDMVNSSDLDNIDDINDKSMKTNKALEVVHLSCNANHENISMESRSRVALRQKPPVPPKPRFSWTALNESRTEKSDTIPNKIIVARPNAERVIKVEGNNNMPATLTAHKEGMKAKPVEAGMSLLGSQPQKESVFMDSNNNLKYHADTLSQVQTLNKSLAQVNEPGMRDSVNSSNFKARRSLDAAMELDFKKTTKRSETSKQHNSRGMGRSLSFTHRSPYVPSPYSPTKTSFPSQSSETNARESSLYTNCLSQVASPIVDSESPQGTFPLFRRTKPRLATPSVPAASHSFTKARSPDGDEIFRLQRPPLKTNSSSRHDVNGNLARNPCQDDYYHVLPKTSTERSNLQFPTDSSNLNTEHKECAYPVELHEDICDNLSPTSTPPPLPDSSPPPLPETSPPKMIPGFYDHDFDFGEQLTDTCHDYTQSEGRQRITFDLPSSARELKTKRSSESLYHKRGNSTDNLLKAQGKICGSSSLSRSLTSTSFPRGVNRRSLSEDILSHKDVVAPTSETKRPSLCFGKPSNLGHVANSCSLLSMDEGETKSLRIKRSKVCEESMSKVNGFKKRLEAFLSGSTTSVTVPDETKNWPLVLQNNARFLACDVKVISSSVKRGSAQVVSAIRASLDSLEQLVESCEKVNAQLSETSTHNVRTLVSMVIEVLDHYGDVIATVKATTVERADDVESLVDKTNAMATIIASLIRTLRKY